MYLKKKLEKRSKKIKKDDGIMAHIAKISSKAERAAKKDNEEGLDITPRLAFKKSDQKKVQLQKINNQSGTSKFEQHHNAVTFKEQPKVKEIIRARKEHKYKTNMKKINSIKVKKVFN